MYLLETANIMVQSFIKFELLSFEHTLKDFKNAKFEIHKINNFLIYQFY